jgi:hypothetical protein
MQHARLARSFRGRLRQKVAFCLRSRSTVGASAAALRNQRENCRGNAAHTKPHELGMARVHKQNNGSVITYSSPKSRAYARSWHV